MRRTWKGTCVLVRITSRSSSSHQVMHDVRLDGRLLHLGAVVRRLEHRDPPAAKPSSTLPSSMSIDRGQIAAGVRFVEIASYSGSSWMARGAPGVSCSRADRGWRAEARTRPRSGPSACWAISSRLRGHSRHPVAHKAHLVVQAEIIERAGDRVGLARRWCTATRGMSSWVSTA